MKDLFYNFDSQPQINKKAEVYPAKQNIVIPNKKLGAYKGAKVLRNIRKLPIGIEASRNSVFRLFFTIDGQVDTGSVQDLLSEAIRLYREDEAHRPVVYFDILNKAHEVVLSCDTRIYPTDQMISVEVIASEDGPVKNGMYTMHLYMIINEIMYDLFTETDGILYID